MIKQHSARHACGCSKLQASRFKTLARNLAGVKYDISREIHSSDFRVYGEICKTSRTPNGVGSKGRVTLRLSFDFNEDAVSEKGHKPFDETRKEKQTDYWYCKREKRKNRAQTACYKNSLSLVQKIEKKKSIRWKCIWFYPTQSDAWRAWRTCSLRSQFSGGVKYQLKKPKIVIAPKMTLAWITQVMSRVYQPKKKGENRTDEVESGSSNGEEERGYHDLKKTD